MWKKGTEKLEDGRIVVYGPPVDRPDAFPMGPWTIKASSIVAFMGQDGLIHAGLLNAGTGDTFDVWLGDVIIQIDAPLYGILYFVNEVTADAGLLVGKTYGSWEEFAKASAGTGNPVDIAGSGDEDVFG